MAVSRSEWTAIKAAHDHRCAYCRNARPLTKDHVIPRSAGGPDVAANVVPACQPCNSAKAAGPVPPPNW